MMMQLRRLEAGWFDHYMEGFETVWHSASPWNPNEREELA